MTVRGTMVRCDVCNSWHQHQLMSSSAHLLICSSGHLLSISINISISISISPSAELLICLSVHLLICSETEKRKKNSTDANFSLGSQNQSPGSGWHQAIQRQCWNFDIESCCRSKKVKFPTFVRKETLYFFFSCLKVLARPSPILLKGRLKL